MKRLRAGDVELCVVVCDGERCQGCSHHLLEQLGPAIADSASGVLVRAGCLAPCDQAPVVVVQRRTTSDQPPVTVALSPTEPAERDALEAWLRAGGPGVGPMPAQLDPCVFSVR